jgi:peptide/nickel transport system permease protein
MIPVMLLVIAIVFTISYIAPGDPVIMILGQNNNTPEAYAKKSAELGLDKPYLVQLGTYIWNLVTKFDLGKSYLTNIPISQELAQRIPITFKISMLGILIMIVVGLPLGMLSALKQYSVLDTTLTSLSLILASMPAFVLALLSALLFGVVLRWLPITGLDNWKAWILPVICSAAGGIAVYT